MALELRGQTFRKSLIGKEKLKHLAMTKSFN